MAVDSKQNGTNGAATNGARTKGNRKRPSSLMAHADALPTVEHSLEEFIAKANQTLVDVSAWGNADAEAKAAEEARRQQDALRMKAAETQMREGEAREASLRRQLDGLQGKLAEAEARAAVASTTAGSAANDAALQALREQIEMAEAQRKAAELEKQALAKALKDAKEEVAVVRATTSMPAVSVPVEVDNSEALERIRIAEEKARLALAAAKAAQAGLSVDLTPIETGLATSHVPVKSGGAPWALIAVAFVGGLGIMFAVWKLVLSKDDAKPAAQPAAATQPAPAADTTNTAPDPAPAAAAAPTEAKPTVTPIEEAPKPTVEPIEEPAVKEEPTAATEETKAPAAAMEEPKTEPKVEAKKAEPKAATKKVTAPKATKKETPKKETKKATKPAVVDPFGESPAPKKTAPKKETKPAGGGIVDPVLVDRPTYVRGYRLEGRRDKPHTIPRAPLIPSRT